MHGLKNEEVGALSVTEVIVHENRSRADDRAVGCKALWLTPREAESLLVLCVASPVSAGPTEQDLFQKLGDYFRSHSR